MKKLEKIEKVEPPKRHVKVDFEFMPAPRSGDDVAKLEKVSKGYGKKRIYEGFDFLVRRGERWCVMGVNGAGKSTLLKLIAGHTTPDEGKVTLGGEREDGLLRPARHGAAGRRAARSSSPWPTRSRAPTPAPCGCSPAASASPATRWTRSAACSPEARRRAW